MQICIDRVKKLYNDMSLVGRTHEGGVSRITLSKADQEARDLFVEWLKNHNMDVRIDDIGNIYGRMEGKDPSAKPIVLGSHLDSVTNSGTFDGSLGLIAGLEVIQTLHDHSITPKRPIEVVNFTNEEGVRFKHLMTGSGVLSGEYEIEDVYRERDEDGKCFLDELRSIHYLGEKSNRLQSAEAFLELHIEQGPILYAEDIPIGAVESTLGSNWLEVKVVGEENNSGPTPMHLRKDPVVSVAKMITEINTLVHNIGPRAITTVGNVTVHPGNINTIPGEVTFLVDVRGEHVNENELGLKLVCETIDSIAKRDDMEVCIEIFRSANPAVFSKDMIETIIDAANKRNYPVKRVVSGAGHIASFMNDFCPTAMIFVPSVDGKSHSPEEFTRWGDIEKGTNTLLDVVIKLADR